MPFCKWPEDCQPQGDTRVNFYKSMKGNSLISLDSWLGYFMALCVKFYTEVLW